MSQYLLDTHVVLWANAQPQQLGPVTTQVLTDTTNELAISAISVAEIAIKRSIGKLRMTQRIDDLISALGATHLSLTTTHAQGVETLPLIHRDPFDRLLAAQAQADDLVLITADERLLAYPIITLDART